MSEANDIEEAAINDDSVENEELKNSSTSPIPQDDPNDKPEGL